MRREQRKGRRASDFLLKASCLGGMSTPCRCQIATRNRDPRAAFSDLGACALIISEKRAEIAGQQIADLGQFNIGGRIRLRIFGSWAYWPCLGNTVVTRAPQMSFT